MLEQYCGSRSVSRSSQSTRHVCRQPESEIVRGEMTKALVRSMRPHQWISNLVVFAPLVFSENLFNLTLLVRVGIGFLLLCGLSSVTFLVNDVIDLERDRRHPVRSRRPMAAGTLTERKAITAATILAAASLAGALVWQTAFGLVALGYLLMMLGYSVGLRNLPVLDVMVIAAGLVFRAVAGALLIEVTISPWLYLSVGGLGLILALGRVQYEMRLAEITGTLQPGKYTLEAVARMNSVTIAVTLIVYCLYTFLAPNLPANHGMMLTIPFVIYGIFRYRYLTRQQPEEKSPEQLVLSDTAILIAVALWALAAVAVQYLLPPA
jgi:4-hydroxybenzoate polyprenyltransferase